MHCERPNKNTTWGSKTATSAHPELSETWRPPQLQYRLLWAQNWGWRSCSKIRFDLTAVAVLGEPWHSTWEDFASAKSG
eukprot:s739_g14.t1